MSTLEPKTKGMHLSKAGTPGTVEVHNLIFCHQTPLEQQNQQLFLLAAAPLCDSLPRGK